jgi:phage-related protein
VTLIPVAKGFQQKIATEMAGVGGAGGVAGKKFSQGFGGAIKGLIGPALIAGAGVAITGFVKSSVKQASTLEESLNAVSVSFGASSEGIKRLGQEAASSLGVSNAEFNKAAVGFASFAKQIAGPGVDVTQTIDDLTTRASDFASVMDLEVSDALSKFRAGLSGEAEPLKQFGINVSEANVKAFAMANGIGAIGSELTETEKIQARYGFIMQETTLMAGDFANTADGWANSMRILKSTSADAQAELGNVLLPVLQTLVPAIMPIIKQSMPVLIEMFNALTPAIEAVIANIGPFFDAMMPLFDAFNLLIGAGGDIIAAILPPLVKILKVLAPIVLAVVEAFLPLVEALLPPLIRLVEALIPFLEMFASQLADFWIPLLGRLIEAILPFVVYFIDLFARALEDLNTILGPVFAALKPVADALLAIAGIKPGDLKKNITVTSNVPAGLMDSEARRDAAMAARFAGSQIVPGAVTPDPILTGGTGTGSDAQKVITEAIRGARKAIKSARKEYRKEVRQANEEFAKSTAEISEDFSIAVARASINRDNELAQALKDNTKRVAEIQADFAKRLDDIVKQSMQRLRDAYRSAVEINVASIFDGDVVAGSIDGTIEMMRQKLIASRQLLANAASLAAAGFSQTFIEQVVGAGTDVGNELAQSILNATPEQQSEMRTLFNAIETEASSGMDALSETIYEKNGLATEGLKDLYAQTQNELVVALADQEALYQQTMADILVRFDEAVASAATTRDQALLEAQATLDEALLTASDKFKDQLKAINKEFKSVIKEMKGEVAGMASAIANLRSAISSARSEAASASAAAAAASAASAASASAGRRTKLATGGLVTGPTNALIGEAGPELVIPLDKFESWMNMGAGGGKALNYYAAPNQSLDSETELFNAMKRAKVVVGW